MFEVVGGTFAFFEKQISSFRPRIDKLIYLVEFALENIGPLGLARF